MYGLIAPAGSAVRMRSEKLIFELTDFSAKLKRAVRIDTVLLRETPPHGAGDLAAGDRQRPLPVFGRGIGESDDDSELGDILRLCGEALDQLGVAWRYSRRNSISVARREAVARLDEFVGPKY